MSNEIKIAVDVDGTLIKKGSTGRDVPRLEVLAMLDSMDDVTRNVHWYVWSGSGTDYAKDWLEKLGLENVATVVPKGSIEVDIAIDDEDVKLGKVNIKV